MPAGCCVHMQPGCIYEDITISLHVSHRRLGIDWWSTVPALLSTWETLWRFLLDSISFVIVTFIDILHYFPTFWGLLMCHCCPSPWFITGSGEFWYSGFRGGRLHTDLRRKHRVVRTGVCLVESTSQFGYFLLLSSNYLPTRRLM